MTRHNKVFDEHSKLLKAGVITVRKNGAEVLMVAGRSGDFSFPKGHLEPGETPEECAVREAKEETGLNVVLGPKLPKFCYRNEKTKDDIEVNLYLVKEFSGELKRENYYNRLRWVPVTKVSDFTEYQNQVDYINFIKDRL